MNAETYARELKAEVNKILYKWRTVEETFHDRLLCKDICLMIIDRETREEENPKLFAFFEEARKIIENE